MERSFDQISIKELFEQANTSEKILWSNIMLITGQNCAIRPLYYEGAIAGSEFATYIANKMYVSIDSQISYNTYGNASPAQVVLYNQSNVSKITLVNIQTYWNVTTASVYFAGNTIEMRNLTFSRITVLNYNEFIFKGFRIIF